MAENPTWIPVVAVALVRGDGRVLMQKRAAGRALAGLWEFPGGKIEAGESPETAAVREIAEELGVRIAAGALQPAGFSSEAAQAPAPRQPHVILLYICREWHGEPACLDAEAIAWFAPDELASLAMPPLDVPLAEGLVRLLAAV